MTATEPADKAPQTEGSFASFIERSWAFYTENLDEGSKLQTCIIEAEDGSIQMVVCPWDGDDERGQILLMLKLLIAKCRAKRYAFLSEAWEVSYEGGKIPEGAPQPCDSPHRLSVIVMSGCDRATGAKMFRRALLTGFGSKRGLKPHEDHHGEGLGGDLLRLFEIAERLNAYSH